MRLSKLKIQGFKSFAEKIVLEFPEPKNKEASKGITAVLGPNGAGKSNIADAVRWVLGEQSAKIIRAKSQEDVIFGGSQKRERLSRAEVSVYLNNNQNSDKKYSLPYREIEISRRLYRNGETKYLINNQEVRLFDIIMLLAEANFSQKNYTVIGQGMIENILYASPTDRLDFFYDAVGVKKYQIKLNKTQNKLKRTTGSLAETKLLLTETSPHLKYLSRQVKKWEQRMKISIEFKNKAQIYYSLKYNELELKFKEKNQEYNLLSKQHQNIFFKLEEIRKKIKTIAQTESTENEYQKLQKIISEKNQEKNKLLERKIYWEKEMEANLENAGKMDLAWAWRRTVECREQIEEQEKNLKALKKIIANQQIAIRNKNQDKTQVCQHIQELEKEIIVLEKTKTIFAPLEIRQELEEIRELIINYGNAKEESESHLLLKQLRDKIDFLISDLSTQSKPAKQTTENLIARIEDFKQQREELIASLNDLNLNLKINLEKTNFWEKNIKQTKLEEKNLLFKIDKLKHQDEKNNLREKIRKEKEEVEKKIKDINKDLDSFQEEINKFNQKQEQKKQSLITLEQQNYSEQKIADHLSNLISVVKINLAKLEEQKLNLEKEILENLEPGFKSQNLLPDSYNLDELWQIIIKLKKQLETMGSPEEEIIKEYQELKERHSFLKEQTSDLEQTTFSLNKVVQKLEGKIKKEFKEKFKILNREFKRYFKILFNGGSTELAICEIEKQEEKEDLDSMRESVVSLENETLKNKAENCSEESLKEKTGQKQKGIEIFACPPGKRIKNIAMLSGGEKAITFCALICAIITSNPPPFVILDEVDAALDEANSLRLAVILKKLSQKTQFILITHNRAIMETADVLYGVSMNDEGVSKILSLKLEDD